MIALDPNQTWEVGFDHEKALPPDQRNLLICRFATDAQYCRIGDLGEEANLDATTAQRRRAALIEALGILAVRWRGPLVGQETFDPARVGGKLSIDDMWELFGVLRTQMRLAEQERKKSLLPSGSAATATSAGSAGAELPAAAV